MSTTPAPSSTGASLPPRQSCVPAAEREAECTARNSTCASRCAAFRSCRACTADLGCGWCSTDSTCYSADKASCAGNAAPIDTLDACLGEPAVAEAGGVSRLAWDSNSPLGGRPDFDNLETHELLAAARSDIESTEAFLREALLAEIRVATSDVYDLGVASDSGSLVRFWQGPVVWADAIDENSLVFSSAMWAGTAAQTSSVSTFATSAQLSLEAGVVYQLYSRSNTNRGRRHFHSLSLVPTGTPHT